MKTLIVGLISSLLLIAGAPAAANGVHGSVVIRSGHHHGFHGHHRHHLNYHRHWHPVHGWVIPAVIGGAVVYAATRPAPVVVQQPPVIVNETVVLQPNQVVIDGVIYNKAKMIINGVEQEVLVKNLSVSPN